MGYINIVAESNFNLQSFAQQGLRKVDAGFQNIDGEYYRVIYALDDSIISTVSEKGDSLSSVPVLAGAVVYGLFLEVHCEVGVVIAYIA